MITPSTTPWVVLKFGGTSVSGRPQWQVIAGLVQARRTRGARVLLVCSAVSGVTNDLAALADDPASEVKITALLQRHRRLAGELGVTETGCLQLAEATIRRCAHELAAAKSPGEEYAVRAELLGMGEWLSTRIGAEFLKQFVAVSWVDVRTALRVREEPQLSAARQWLSASCEPGGDAELARRWQQLEAVVITQGFMASTGDGRTALLGRGGSDTSAALLAGRLEAFELEIWTDVPGLFSADPRLVPQARLLAELAYDEALEMAASGAKVVHPRCIRAAAATRTPVLIRDTGRPGLGGTRIGYPAREANRTEARGVKAITCQKDMVVLLLQNIDTRREVGFLARVFDIFRRHGVSIDLVATSETTTTVALNGPANHLDEPALARLVDELQTQCTVKLYTHCVCINLVGTAVRTALADLQSTMRFFDDHPLLMLSQSANDLCLSLLLEAADHELLLRRAHEVLIPSGAGPAAHQGVFGPSWQEIQA